MSLILVQLDADTVIIDGGTKPMPAAACIIVVFNVVFVDMQRAVLLDETVGPLVITAFGSPTAADRKLCAWA